MTNDTTFASERGYTPPSSILIVGSGVFGLTTAWALTKRAAFSSTRIILVDRVTDLKDGDLPSGDAASMDSSRIVRADYADALYARLAAEAQRSWRGELGEEGRYSESGLLIVGEEGCKGMVYVKGSFANVMDIAREQGYADKIVEMESGEKLRELLGTVEKPGDWGYLNTTSGWADAAKGIKWLLDKVKATGRVEFVSGTVEKLVRDDAKGEVKGVKLKEGSTLEAELVVVAAGAWTGTLVDLRGLVTATGQVLAYMDLTDEEQEKLTNMPVVLNLASGLFIIPPRNKVLKVARHAFGYLNPVDIPAATLLPKKVTETGDTEDKATIRVSAPKTLADSPTMGLPREAEVDLRRSLRQFIPLESVHDRAFTSSRICWYSDTPDADYLVDYHPSWKGVFVATGDSGHGYKFLPVLGDKIVDCITGEGDESVRKKWRWKEGKVSVVDGMDAIITEDGSRGSSPGKILDRELENKV
ncbi:hypothetical protein jhhlp_003299 [Lomentospora prolificans]|uniref:FAD dependent oxidoreductase domain-containing protein n=1 Tax=Lomentospora prolificans TaxID=41688 RepID=A0A2N3NGI0_9PEZI|nr:hypothetical protein jhhlp_003299 [Lomentospora prolificans]